jgi:S-adenosylmethionine:tRNA ribosyltransferase-isomerase
MNLSDFNYNLPPERIAQHPLEERDQSKLMVLDRASQTIGHHRFFELPNLLDPNSVLVFNESRVIPARIKFKFGNGKAEILLTKPLRENVWECLVRPGDKFQPKRDIQIDPELSIHVEDVLPNGLRIIHFKCKDLKVYLRHHGHAPTPPYIKETLEDPERYQTVYAKTEGSSAAPTAGLHFTQRVFDGLKAKGIQTEFVTLHVGLGTFQPVKTETIEEHQIHSEWFSLSDETARRLNEAKRAGKKIVAVGTTSVRVLETCSDDKGHLAPQSADTNIFIYPGYRWKFVDQMVTNFHVPKSTLLMLVSSFATPRHSHESGNLPTGSSEDSRLHGNDIMDGRDFILKAYETAKENDYRFFSFGDAMWIQ